MAPGPPHDCWSRPLRESIRCREVNAEEQSPPGTAGQGMLIVRWSDGTASEAPRLYAEESLISDSDLAGKTWEQVRAVGHRRDVEHLRDPARDRPPGRAGWLPSRDGGRSLDEGGLADSGCVFEDPPEFGQHVLAKEGGACERHDERRGLVCGKLR